MESLCVNWYTKEERYRECLDGDGIDMSGEYYSFPVQTSHTREIAFTLNRDIGLSSLSVYALDTDPVDTRIVW